MTDTVFRRLSIALMSLLVFGGVFLFGALTASAQSFDGSIQSRDIQMNLSPQTPGTNETVTVSIDSLVVNVNRMRITWFVDGEVVASGIGITEVEAQTKGQGELTRVEAYIQIDNETNLRKWIQIAPADLDILWQANTYTPPFYRGKALPTPESIITIIGLPNLRNGGAQTQENAVVFTWRHNGTNLPDDSGYGANPLIIRNDFLDRQERVELTAIHPDGLSSANRSVTINITDPVVTVYEQGSYLRRANRPDRQVAGNRLTFIAEPYYFSITRDTLDLLRYRWTINNEVVSTDASPRKHMLEVRTTNQGAAEVGISIQHPLKPLQLSPLAKFTVIQ